MLRDGEGRRVKGEGVGSRLGAAIRCVLGMPRYDDYLAHMRCKHPEQVPLSERDYFNQYLEHRYAGGPTRCC